MQTKNAAVGRWLNSPRKLMALGLASWPISAGIFAVCLWLRAPWQVAFYLSLPLCGAGMACCLLAGSTRGRSFLVQCGFELGAFLAWVSAGALCFGALKLLLGLSAR